MTRDSEGRVRRAFAAYAALVDVGPDRSEELRASGREQRGRRRTGQLALAAAAAVAAVATGTAYVIHESASPASSHQVTSIVNTSQSESPPANPSASPPPAWAGKCLPKAGKDRLGPAPEYIGLTLRAAIRLGRQSHDDLFPVGAAGRCERPSSSDLVYYAHPIDIVIDKVSMTGRVIVAERVSPDSVRGFPLTGPP